MFQYSFSNTHLNLLRPDEMPFLDGGEGGDSRNNGNGNYGPEHGWHGQEQQQPCEFVSHCVRKTESFIYDQGR